MVFAMITSDGDVMLLFTFPLAHRFNTEANIVGHLDREGGCWKILGLATGFYYATQAGESSDCREKISATVSSLRFGRLIVRIAIPLLYYYVLGEVE